jgi:hypothetical protein
VSLVRTLAAAALLTAAAASHAGGIPPPAFPFTEGYTGPTLPQRPATQLRLGGLTVRLEQTTLAEVQKALGAGEIEHEGDAGDSETWLCYVIPAASGGQILWLTSGELQGDEMIDGVIAQEAGADLLRASGCPPLPPRFRKLAVDGGVWLGASAEQLRRSLPPPSLLRGNWQEFSYSGTFKGMVMDGRGRKSEAEFSEDSDLLLYLENGRVTRLYANKDSSA